MKEITCHACHKAWSFEPPLGRAEECPSCRRDAKVCRNCQFYDPSAHHECRETEAEWVKDKESGNFCSYFSAKSSAEPRDCKKNEKNIFENLESFFSSPKKS